MANERSGFPFHGWVGLILVAIFWALNWALPGIRTHWGFFPLWLGYCLAIDGFVCRRTGTSLVRRGVAGFAGLFLISAPVWWLFEAVNLRTRNWVYLGESQFTFHAFAFWSTISFTTVIPAVFESAELAASFAWVKRLGRGPRIGSEPRMILGFFVLGWIMLISLLCWPRIFFPLVWLSFYLLLEPINVWLGRRSLLEWTAKGDWRPVVALWLSLRHVLNESRKIPLRLLDGHRGHVHTSQCILHNH